MKEQPLTKRLNKREGSCRCTIYGNQSVRIKPSFLYCTTHHPRLLLDAFLFHSPFFGCSSAPSCIHLQPIAPQARCKSVPLAQAPAGIPLAALFAADARGSGLKKRCRRSLKCEAWSVLRTASALLGAQRLLTAAARHVATANAGCAPSPRRNRTQNKSAAGPGAKLDTAALPLPPACRTPASNARFACACRRPPLCVDFSKNTGNFCNAIH